MPPSLLDSSNSGPPGAHAGRFLTRARRSAGTDSGAGQPAATSHVPMISQPGVLTRLIQDAARAVD